LQKIFFFSGEYAGVFGARFAVGLAVVFTQCLFYNRRGSGFQNDGLAQEDLQLIFKRGVEFSFIRIKRDDVFVI